MTQFQLLYVRQMQASLKLGEALGALKNARTALALATSPMSERWIRLRNARIGDADDYLVQAIAAIEAAVKEG